MPPFAPRFRGDGPRGLRRLLWKRCGFPGPAGVARWVRHLGAGGAPAGWAGHSRGGGTLDAVGGASGWSRTQNRVGGACGAGRGGTPEGGRGTLGKAELRRGGWGHLRGGASGRSSQVRPRATLRARWCTAAWAGGSADRSVPASWALSKVSSGASVLHGKGLMIRWRLEERCTCVSSVPGTGTGKGSLVPVSPHIPLRQLPSIHWVLDRPWAVT